MPAAPKICARCGRETSTITRGLCPDCFREYYGVARLPSKMKFVYCPYCGSYLYQGGWNKPVGDITDTIIEYVYMVATKKLRPVDGVDAAWVKDVGITPEFHGPGLYKARIEIAGSIGSTTIEDTLFIDLYVNQGVCPSCTNKITKRGYDAIIQVRTTTGRISDELMTELEDAIGRLDATLQDSIISIEKVREGLDILVEDQTSAKIIASKLRSRFQAKVSEAFKLVGRRQDGKRKGRLTISVRIPDFRKGMVIEFDGERYIIVSRGRNGIIAVNTRTGDLETLRGEYLWSRGFKESHETVADRLMLLSKNGDTILFTSPSNNYSNLIEYPSNMVTVLVEDFVEGGEFKVIRDNRRLYVVERVDGG